MVTIVRDYQHIQ